MTRQELEQFILEEYAVAPEYLWDGDKTSAALRHPNTKKWFGIFMCIPMNKLGLANDSPIGVINVKLDPDFIQTLLSNESGWLFPAYHMNKKHWITITLNDSTKRELAKSLIHEIYRLTL